MFTSKKQLVYNKSKISFARVVENENGIWRVQRNSSISFLLLFYNEFYCFFLRMWAKVFWLFVKLLQSVPKTPVYESRGMFRCELFLKNLLYVFHFWISSEKKDIFWKIFWKGCGSRILCVFSRSWRKNIYKKIINSGFGTKTSVFEQKFCCFGRKTFSTIGTTAFFFSRSKLWRKRAYDENAKALSHFKTPRSKKLLQFCLKTEDFHVDCPNCFP